MLTIVMTVDLKESAGNYTPNQKPSIKSYIRNSAETKLGLIAGYLNIIIGGRRMITENFSPWKSHVINSFLDFLKRWGCTHMVVVTATSGIAAVLLSGTVTATTVHQDFGLNLVHTVIPIPNAEKLQKWPEVFAVIHSLIPEDNSIRLPFKLSFE